MPLELQSVTFESPDPDRDAEFWATLLGRSPQPDAGAILLAGSNGQLGLRFAVGAARGPGSSRMHLHLSQDVRGQWETIDACRAAGGRLRGNGHAPANSYAAMADVVGDDFCVIEDGNRYLEGCGPLGEVTCAGPPSVGRFWSAALGWPLVWEQGEETAIQSPVGGTKVAWSGEWEPPEVGADRQYFTVLADRGELDEEVGRLLALGASLTDEVDARQRAVTLRDPVGMRVVLRERP